MNAVNNAINFNAMGIEELDKAMKDGTVTAQQVLDVLDARINKRLANNKNLIPRVVQFRNDLAKAISESTGKEMNMFQVPVYKEKSSNAPLPSEPSKLADLVFQTIGPAGVPSFISRLTARVASNAAAA